MTDAMDALFSYAQDRMERPLLLAEREYENVLHCANQQEQRLRAMLNDEEKALLDDLLDERNLLNFFHEQAMFLAGFQLAMELGR